MARGRRGGTPEQARRYRQRGHDDARLFAQCLGLGEDYQNDLQAKKDVIDPSGDAHSVKSGKVKWQVFLYRRSRFVEDHGFQGLNGVGELLIRCIDAFPPSFDEYQADKNAAKERLRVPMRELKKRFQRRELVQAFLHKAFFNGGEVNYLTVLHEDSFHVYRNSDVVNAMGQNLTVQNSTATPPDPPEQKVIFKYKGRNLAELEMRNDSLQHYQEIRFNCLKPRCMDLLRENGPQEYIEFLPRAQGRPSVMVYGNAIRTFGRWSGQEERGFHASRRSRQIIQSFLPIDDDS